MKRILMIRVWAIAISAFMILTSVGVLVSAEGTYTVTSITTSINSQLIYTQGDTTQPSFPTQIEVNALAEGSDTPILKTLHVTWTCEELPSGLFSEDTPVNDYSFSPTITNEGEVYTWGDVVEPNITVSVVAATSSDSGQGSEDSGDTGGTQEQFVAATTPTISLPEGHEVPYVGDVLTAVGTGTGVTYSWYADETIVSANSITYTVQNSDLGKVITVHAIQLSNVGGEGNPAEDVDLSSAATGAVIVLNDTYVELTEVPVIAISEDHTVPEIGDTLSTSSTATGVTYQWFADGVAINEATSNTYTVVVADYGKVITVVVTQPANVSYGRPAEAITKTSVATSAVIKQPIAAPAAPSKTTQTYNSVTITTVVNQQYAITTANSAPETGWETATTTTKTYTDLSVGTYYVFTKIPETTSTQEAVSSALEITIAADTYTELTDIPVITISNSHTVPQIGDTLSTSSSATGVTYQWYADAETISGATNNTYTVAATDYGKVITVVVTQPANVSYSRPAEAITKTSAATAAVIKVPVTTPAAPTVTTQTYNSFTISTVNGQYYAMSTTASVPTDGWVLGDGNSKIYSDLSAGTYYVYTMIQETSTSQGAVSSAKSVTIAVDNFVELTVKPVISNTSPKVGDTLTTSSSATSVTYQWYADAEVISGATSTSYTVAEVDLGKVITVVVTQPEDVSYGRPASQITKQSDPTAAVVAAASSSGDSGSGSSSSGSSSSGGSSSESSSSSSSASTSSSLASASTATAAVITPQQEDEAAQAKQEPVVEKVEEVKETLDKPKKDEPKEEVEEESEEEAEKEPVTEKTVSIGEGTVSVKIDSESSTNLSAKLVNVQAIINSVLTEEQLAAVEAGAKVEIKVEMTAVFADDISSQDKLAMKAGMEAYKDELPQMAMANYMDISMFLKIEDGDWNAVRETSQPVEILIDIPKNYLGLSDTYYIMRVHDGEYTLLYDLDDDPNTITISTGMFSTYALMYDKALAAAEEENEEFAVPVNWGIMMAVMLGLAFLGELLFFLNVKRHPKPQRKTSF